MNYFEADNGNGYPVIVYQNNSGDYTIGHYQPDNQGNVEKSYSEEIDKSEIYVKMKSITDDWVLKSL